MSYLITKLPLTLKSALLYHYLSIEVGTALKKPKGSVVVPGGQNLTPLPPATHKPSPSSHLLLMDINSYGAH